MYKWDFHSVLSAWPLLVNGMLGTISLFAMSASTGLVLGMIVGLGRYSRNRVLYFGASCFVEIFRNTPVLIQIMWFYFALPILLPIDISPLTAAWLGISLNTAAFSADIYRGGIQSIELTQWDAARAMAYTPHLIMRRIILPQAIRRILPPLTGRAIECFKMTTMASIISFHETLHAGQLIAKENFNPIEAYTVVAVIFFASLYPIIRVTYRLEAYLRNRGGDVA